MDKIFITKNRNAVSIDKDGNVSEVNHKLLTIDWATILENDCTIEYSQDGETKSVDGKAGQLVLVYYGYKKNKVVIVDNQQMIENFEDTTINSHNPMENIGTVAQGQTV